MHSLADERVVAGGGDNAPAAPSFPRGEAFERLIAELLEDEESPAA